MDQARALIISNDAKFSHSIAERWKSERCVPSFTLMSSDLCPALDPEGFDVAIVGGLGSSPSAPVIRALETCAKPVLLVREEHELPPATVNRKLRLMTLRRSDENWMNSAMLILNECLVGMHANARAQRLERKNAALSKDAALGRYILEMRHSLNNALTSVLGNSELLLLEPETLAPLDQKVRAQIDTIRNMSLRIHEIMQRFSSLEKEMNVADQQAANEIETKSRVASASL